jgi:hypothetical protein
MKGEYRTLPLQTVYLENLTPEESMEFHEKFKKMFSTISDQSDDSIRSHIDNFMRDFLISKKSIS